MYDPHFMEFIESAYYVVGIKYLLYVRPLINKRTEKTKNVKLIYLQFASSKGRF